MQSGHDVAPHYTDLTSVTTPEASDTPGNRPGDNKFHIPRAAGATVLSEHGGRTAAYAAR